MASELHPDWKRYGSACSMYQHLLRMGDGGTERKEEHPAFQLALTAPTSRQGHVSTISHWPTGLELSPSCPPFSSAIVQVHRLLADGSLKSTASTSSGVITATLKLLLARSSSSKFPASCPSFSPLPTLLLSF